jgi:branched-chain amino acid transport system substrate-binding protein
MHRRAVLVVMLVGLVAAACGTRVTEEVSTATSLVERSVSADPLASSDASAGSPVTSTVDSSGDGASSGTGNAAGSPTGAGVTVPSGNAAAPANRPASGAPIVLGAVGTKSGIVGSALSGGFRGLSVWEKWVNAHGGVQGRPVKVIQVDDGSDPAKHAAAVRKLILEDRVVAFIGNIAPFTFSAGASLLADNRMAAIGGDGAEAGWFQSPFAFPINGQTISRSRPAAKWALAHLKERRAAVIYVSEADAPAQLAHNFADEWRRGGGQVVLDAGVSIATPDFTGEVVQAKNSGADILFLLLEKAACNRFFDAAQRQQYKPVMIAPACTIDTALDHRDLTTNRLYAAHAGRSPKPGTPAQDEAIAAGKRFDPSLELDGAFLFGWLAGKLFEAAMAQPGTSLTPAGIVDALHRLPATGLGGLTPVQAWGPGPHAEGRCGLVSRFDGTQFALQTPDFLC